MAKFLVREPRQTAKQFRRLCTEMKDVIENVDEEYEPEDVVIYTKRMRSERSDCRTVLLANNRQTSRLKKELKAANEEINKQDILAKNCLLVMASNNLSRVNCPSEDVIRSVRFGKKKAVGRKHKDSGGAPELLFPEELLLACSTRQCPPERFTELYTLAKNLGKEDPAAEEWKCTLEDTLLTGKDVFGMCPGSRLHETDEQRTPKDAEGDPGAKGAKVAKGDTEEKGDTGEKGDGPPGPPGKDGAKGEEGETGELEAKGDTEANDAKGDTEAKDKKEPSYDCRCDYCRYEHRKQEIRKRVKEAREAIDEVEETTGMVEARIDRASKLLKRAKLLEPPKRKETVFDPVFTSCTQVSKQSVEDAQGGDFESDTERNLSRRQVRRMSQSAALWQTLINTLCVDDLPLRIAFLDKSGSMGCDDTTFNALMLALNNALHPTRGTTLTLLMAAPGETQIILRRPSDAPMEDVTLRLGNATWFNEPLIRTLKFLAPFLQKINFQAFFNERGEPPVQIICLTDGQDNMSVPEVQKFGPLINAIKEIKYPDSGNRAYKPLVPFAGAKANEMTVTDQRCPLWMCWMAIGIGGMTLLQDQVLQLGRGSGSPTKLPREILFLDCSTTPVPRDTAYLYDDSSSSEDSDATFSSSDSDADDDAYAASDENLPLLIPGHGQKGSPHYQRSTKASNARQRRTGTSVKRQAAKIVGAIKKPQEWKMGNRVNIRTTKGRNRGTVLEKEGDFYDILVEGTNEKQTISAKSVVGKPPQPKSMLVKAQTGKVDRAFSQSDPRFYNGQAICGIQARQNADPMVQAKQVLQVVNGVTKDLASLLSQDLHSTREETKRQKSKDLPVITPLKPGRVFPLEAAAAVVELNSTDGTRQTTMETIMAKTHKMEERVRVRREKAQKISTHSTDDTDGAEPSEDETLAGVEDEVKRDKKQTKDVRKKPAGLLTRAMKILGKASQSIPSSDRALAQALCAVGLEFLFWGGALDFDTTSSESILLEQLGNFIDLSPQRLRAHLFVLGTDRSKRQLEIFRNTIEKPLVAMLKFCLTEKLIIESKQGLQYRRVYLVEKRRQELHALWRFVNPTSQPRGATDDSLRLCINYSDALRPPVKLKLTQIKQFSAGGQAASSSSCEKVATLPRLVSQNAASVSTLTFSTEKNKKYLYK